MTSIQEQELRKEEQANEEEVTTKGKRKMGGSSPEGGLNPKKKPKQNSTIEQVYEILLKDYGKPNLTLADPVAVLVETILSQNTNDANSHAAFLSLIKKFPSWSQIISASTEDVEQAIKVAGLSKSKAKTIQNALKTIPKVDNNPSLAFLENKTREEALKYLQSMPGIGPKTSACVLIFGLGIPSFPVDTHVFRVTSRLGLISGDSKKSPKSAQEKLEQTVPNKIKHPLHLLLISHGRKVCSSQRPHCSECSLSQLCPKIDL